VVGTGGTEVTVKVLSPIVGVGANTPGGVVGSGVASSLLLQATPSSIKTTKRHSAWRDAIERLLRSGYQRPIEAVWFRYFFFLERSPRIC
jgi:hypothetical protein